MLIRRPDDGEPVDDVVGYELGIRASDFGMMQIIVSLAPSHVCGKLFWKLFGSIPGDQIDYVVRHQGAEPPDLFSRRINVVGYPGPRRAPDTDAGKVAARLLASLAHRPQAPFDQMWIRALKYDPVGKPTGGPKHLRTV